MPSRPSVTTDEEFLSFARDLWTVVQPRLANAPSKERRRRILYSVILPALEEDR